MRPPHRPFLHTKQRISGFSLVELLVVIAVIGIMAAIALPALANIFESTEKNGYKRNAQTIISMHNSAVAAGVDFSSANTPSDVVTILQQGRTGKGAMRAVSFQISELDQEEINGALGFLELDQNTRFMRYTGALNSGFGN